MVPPPPRSPLFPYTTLFRSPGFADALAVEHDVAGVGRQQPRHEIDERRLAGSRVADDGHELALDRKSTRLNSSHRCISYAVFCLKKKKKESRQTACRST